MERDGRLESPVSTSLFSTTTVAGLKECRSIGVGRAAPAVASLGPARWQSSATIRRPPHPANPEDRFECQKR